MNITIEISPGEFLDRISILHIKQRYIKDKDKRKNIDFELNRLMIIYSGLYMAREDYKEFFINKYEELENVNRDIWDLEEELRSFDEFPQDRVDIPIDIAKFNDERALIKKEINILLGSDLVEEKSHKNL